MGMDDAYKMINQTLVSLINEIWELEEKAIITDEFKDLTNNDMHVIEAIGLNKVTRDVDSAMSRARNEAAPINAQRFNLSTPCCKTGACFDCKTPDTICCQILITRYSKTPQRIKVILVNEDLGF